MSAGNYAELLLGRRVIDKEFDERFGSDWKPVGEAHALFCSEMRAAFGDFGYNVGSAFDKHAVEFSAWLENQQAFAGEGDDYTGFYWKLNPSRKKQLVSDFLNNQEQSRRIGLLGDTALIRALSALSFEEGWLVADDRPLEPSVASMPSMAPGSDRVVTFSDNQIDDLEPKVSAVIEAVEQQNQIADLPGFRELILGQLKAGRELIRAGSVRLYLLEIALIEALRTLVVRYEKEAIGALASTLLAALANHIGLVS